MQEVLVHDGTVAHYLCLRQSHLLSEAGNAIMAAIRSASPDGVWVQHACEYTPKLTRGVPRDGVLILDTDGSRREFCEDLPYIAGMRVSEGAHTVLSGNAGAVLKASFPEDAAGVGVFSDYTLANPLYAACAYRRLGCRRNRANGRLCRVIP